MQKNISTLCVIFLNTIRPFLNFTLKIEPRSRVTDSTGSTDFLMIIFLKYSSINREIKMKVDDLYDDYLEDYVRSLIDTDAIFRRIFVPDFDLANLSVDEQSKAEELFLKKYPQGVMNHPTLSEFLRYWKDNTVDDNGSSVNYSNHMNDNVPLFDSRSKRVVHSKIYPPAKRGRGRPEEFDVFKFIMRKTNSYEVYPIQLNLNADDDVNLDMSFEERTMMENKADHALRETAKIIETLNQLNNYKVMDLASERRILH